mmetsp:Transcript_1240/g.3132  ORF Transcript_1240/g.3132 Transcript_1240/m.3132 type:complete len:87 (-) Transcript_1240:98-358(-)
MVKQQSHSWDRMVREESAESRARPFTTAARRHGRRASKVTQTPSTENTLPCMRLPYCTIINGPSRPTIAIFFFTSAGMFAYDSDVV